MRKVITISMSEEMHAYVVEQAGFAGVSEYIRSLVRSEKRRRAAELSRPSIPPPQAGDTHVLVAALDQLERLKAILERRERR